MNDKLAKYSGGNIAAISNKTISWSVRRLLELDRKQLSSMKVRSGEHLAAILITAFLAAVPYDIDTDGDVDLRFRTSPWSPLKLLPPSVKSAAFEVSRSPDDSVKWIAISLGCNEQATIPKASEFRRKSKLHVASCVTLNTCLIAPRMR